MPRKPATKIKPRRRAKTDIEDAPATATTLSLRQQRKQQRDEDFVGEFIPDFWHSQARATAAKIFQTVGDLGSYSQDKDKDTQVTALQLMSGIVDNVVSNASLMATRAKSAVDFYTKLGNEQEVNASRGVEGAQALSQNYFSQANQLRVDPPPADFMAMMRLADYTFRTEGDVFQTVHIPIQLLLKQVEVNDWDGDPGATKAWQELFTDKVPINNTRLKACEDVNCNKDYRQHVSRMYSPKFYRCRP